MPALNRNIGDLVLAEGRPGRITGFWADNPEVVTFPYYVDIQDGAPAQLYAEYELKDFPDKASEDVWESMAYAYWHKWSETQNELDELRDKIRGLVDDVFA